MAKITAREYHRRARQCMRIAAAVHEIAHKEFILDMGREWMMLAVRAEKDQATPDASVVRSASQAEPTGPEHTTVPGWNPKTLN
jgi:hypothetical protein